MPIMKLNVLSPVPLAAVACLLHKDNSLTVKDGQWPFVEFPLTTARDASPYYRLSHKESALQSIIPSIIINLSLASIRIACQHNALPTAGQMGRPQ